MNATRMLLIGALMGLLLARPQDAPAKVRPGMLAMGIGGSVMVVGGAVGGLIFLESGAVLDAAADGEWSSSQDSYYATARNGHYYNSYGINDLNNAATARSWATGCGVVALIGIPVAIIGFVNMRDPNGAPTPRQRRQRRYRDQGRLSPLLDFSEGSLMALAPDLQPMRHGGARATLFQAQF
jgi:hypothetical protein